MSKDVGHTCEQVPLALVSQDSKTIKKKMAQSPREAGWVLDIVSANVSTTSTCPAAAKAFMWVAGRKIKLVGA